MSDNNHKNIATFMHLGIFSRYIIPFGNYIIPILLWTVNKDKSGFIDRHGKEAINFQLSILLYTIILGTLSIPFFIFNLFGDTSLLHITHLDDLHIDFSHPGGFRTLIGASFVGIIALIGFFIEIVFIISAAMKANKGEEYKYPLTIRFIK
ncbi:DUF4870 domain-containing protein [Aquimarina sp. U1-2]|uniref:DUF4870 domain-containing protein n=1 Tax=Aquimarina sp. U1-2 TaxID=2823141 RepID=UPI001AECC499|nr:DUF4870 domain-containing protein [Aquimarina sp. U1-2]MBP2833417.1 DUF4870 domain-containing protein [Aquimarina sp. U1-2]